MKYLIAFVLTVAVNLSLSYLLKGTSEFQWQPEAIVALLVGLLVVGIIYMTKGKDPA